MFSSVIRRNAVHMDVHDGTHGTSEIDEDRHQVDEEANHDPSAPEWFQGWSEDGPTPKTKSLEIRKCVKFGV